MQVRRTALAAFVLLGSLGLGAAAEAVGGASAQDMILPRDGEVDSRLVVVVFDGRADGGTGSEVSHLRATYFQDIAQIASRGGAAAVGFVDFDSLTFSDGAGGRANVVRSAELQQLGIIPIQGAARRPAHDDRLDFLVSYRIDALATELAGIGVGAVGDAAQVRMAPSGARVVSVEDGVIVETPPFAEEAVDRRSDIIVPGLSFRLVEHAFGDTISDPGLESIRLGTRPVPLEDGALRISWTDELDDGDDLRLIPFFDLLAGEVPAAVFDRAVVLVGTVDPSKTRFVETPAGRLPPVLVEANAVNTLLTQRWTRPGSAALPWAIAVAVVVAMIVFTRFRRLRPAAPLLGVVGAFGWWFTASALAAGGTLVVVLGPVVTLTSGAVLLVASLQVDALTERRRLRSLFSQYVPASIADQLVASGRGRLASAGERVAITALFCDLRGFTPLAARLEPSQVRELLNAYYEEMARVIFDCDGTVLQYIGDEIYAVFGAPLPSMDHAARALSCARRLFERRGALNERLAEAGLPPLNFGIGLHSGDAIAAHVGSSVRMQYAVIGDTVNVASRHRSLAGPGEIVLSSTTAALAGSQPDAVEEDASIRGLDGERRIFRIVCGPSSSSGTADSFDDGATDDG